MLPSRVKPGLCVACEELGCEDQRAQSTAAAPSHGVCIPYCHPSGTHPGKPLPIGSLVDLVSYRLLKQEASRESDVSFVRSKEGVVEKISHGKLVINILICLFCPHPLFNRYSVQVKEAVQKC